MTSCHARKSGRPSAVRRNPLGADEISWPSVTYVRALRSATPGFEIATATLGTAGEYLAVQAKCTLYERARRPVATPGFYKCALRWRRLRWGIRVARNYRPLGDQGTRQPFNGSRLNAIGRVASWLERCDTTGSEEAGIFCRRNCRVMRGPDPRCSILRRARAIDTQRSENVARHHARRWCVFFFQTNS